MTYLGTYYRGHDLLTEMPNGREERDESLMVATDVLDGGTGQITGARVWDSHVPTRPHLWTLPDRTAITDFLIWFAERRGRYWPLWVPTWRRDFVLMAAVASDATDLTVSYMGYTANQFPSESRKHLAVIVSGGGTRTVYPRRITASVDNEDGTETLTIESAVGVALDTHVVLSYLVLARLADDAVTLEWFHKGAAEARTRFVELPREVEG